MFLQGDDDDEEYGEEEEDYDEAGETIMFHEPKVALSIKKVGLEQSWILKKIFEHPW